MRNRPLPSVIYWRALKEARPWYPQLAAIVILGLIATPIGLLAPLPVKVIVDSVLGDAPLPAWLVPWLPDGAGADKQALLYLSVLFGILLAALVAVHGMSEWLYRETVADQMVRRFRAKVMRKALALPFSREADKGVVDQVFRINQDAPSLQAMTIWGVIPLAVKGLSVLWVLWFTALIHPQAAAAALATVVPLIVAIVLAQRSLCDRWHVVRQRESRLMQLAYEVLGAQRVVVSSGREPHEMERLVEQGRICFGAKLRVLAIEALFKGGLTLAIGVGTAAMLFVGARDGSLSAGDLIMLVAYMAQLYEPLRSIAEHIVSQQSAFASGERAFELLEQPPAMPEAATARALTRARGHVEFRDVSFGYPGSPAVLRGAAFTAPAGSCVGVVGRTGSGKSTLVNLLARLIDPTGGEIRLDGVDLRGYRLADLRRQFAIVEQEPSLFTTTIAENIAYGRPEASRAEIEDAARRARAHDFIMRLPGGYESLSGERASQLSGGERQRICLARAFLKQAPILILDEPTSALDEETEAAIADALDELMRGRTTFIVSHRAATLRRADLILRVQAGGVLVEPGRRVMPVAAPTPTALPVPPPRRRRTPVPVAALPAAGS